MPAHVWRGAPSRRCCDLVADGDGTSRHRQRAAHRLLILDEVEQVARAYVPVEAAVVEEVDAGEVVRPVDELGALTGRVD